MATPSVVRCATVQPDALNRKELKDKVKQRAALNGRSLNAELVQIVQDAMAQPSPVFGYRSDSEKLADAQAETVKKMVFETLVQMYADKK
ncbi:Arc family DNA-binding protein [Serratia fonticola]|uniref:Arc family DNA-binding protein n=1 Tax=Serratia fonticola TaxID=47917 RepID=UPI0027FA3006|nr:Arc family DNA-binding protein [Serratia fonticola]MDQ7207996.1 Arc family DNA-binding protein [Serratia fonticola]